MNEIKLYEMLGRQLAEIEWLRAEVARLSDERDEAVILAGKHFAELELHRSNCQELSKTLIKMCNRNDELEEELARSQPEEMTVDHVPGAHESIESEMGCIAGLLAMLHPSDKVQIRSLERRMAILRGDVNDNQ